MISPITKLKLFTLATKYGIEIEHFTPGEVSATIGTWEQHSTQLHYLMNDFRADPHIHSITFNDGVVHILYDHDALEEQETIDRWLKLFDEYS